MKVHAWLTEITATSSAESECPLLQVTNIFGSILMWFLHLVLQPWTRSLPPRSIWCHMEGQLWHSHPSGALRAVLQNLCLEGAQTAVFCQEEGQCKRYKHEQAHAGVRTSQSLL